MMSNQVIIMCIFFAVLYFQIGDGYFTEFEAMSEDIKKRNMKLEEEVLVSRVEVMLFHEMIASIKELTKIKEKNLGEISRIIMNAESAGKNVSLCKGDKNEELGEGIIKMANGENQLMECFNQSLKESKERISSVLSNSIRSEQESTGVSGLQTVINDYTDTVLLSSMENCTKNVLEYIQGIMERTQLLTEACTMVSRRMLESGKVRIHSMENNTQQLSEFIIIRDFSMKILARLKTETTMGSVS